MCNMQANAHTQPQPSHLPRGSALPQTPLVVARNIAAAKLLTRIPRSPGLRQPQHAQSQQHGVCSRAASTAKHSSSEQQGCSVPSTALSAQQSGPSLSAASFGTLCNEALPDCWQDDDSSLLHGLVNPADFEPRSDAQAQGTSDLAPPTSMQLQSTSTHGTVGTAAATAAFTANVPSSAARGTHAAGAQNPDGSTTRECSMSSSRAYGPSEQSVRHFEPDRDGAAVGASGAAEQAATESIIRRSMALSDARASALCLSFMNHGL